MCQLLGENYLKYLKGKFLLNFFGLLELSLNSLNNVAKIADPRKTVDTQYYQCCQVGSPKNPENMQPCISMCMLSVVCILVEQG